VEAADVERLVGELEVAVDRLRGLYEQYFMGIERLEPTVPRKEVERRIYVLRKEQIRNTAQRFRFQMLLQRYSTYQTHWLRICRDIENGTYKRHVARALRRFGQGARRASVPPPAAAPRSAPPPATPRGRTEPDLPPPVMSAAQLAAELAELDREFAPAEDAGIDVEFDESPLGGVARRPPPPPPRPGQGTAHKPAPALPGRPPPAAPAVALGRPATPIALPIRPRAAHAPPHAPARGDDLPEERLRELYAKYVLAKRQQRESTATITYEAVAKSLRDSSARLREKHGKAVDFEVAVKDGKAILRPVLK
jgi:hypothetical protein